MQKEKRYIVAHIKMLIEFGLNDVLTPLSDKVKISFSPFNANEDDIQSYNSNQNEMGRLLQNSFPIKNEIIETEIKEPDEMKEIKEPDEMKEIKEPDEMKEIKEPDEIKKDDKISRVKENNKVEIKLGRSNNITFKHRERPSFRFTSKNFK